jgi:hypothetical protein
MPALTKLLLPRLVPIRGGMLREVSLNEDAPDGPLARFPEATLNLLWAILAEDPTLWPYGIEKAVEKLSRDPRTTNDPRLSELRRRREN